MTMHIVVKTIEIGNNLVCQMAARFGATILPVYRNTIIPFADLPEGVANVVFQPSKGWKQPTAMIFHGKIDECLEWLCDTGDRTEKAIVWPTEELPESYQGRLFQKYAYGVISESTHIRDSATRLDIPALDPNDLTLDKLTNVFRYLNLHDLKEARTKILFAGIGQHHGTLPEMTEVFSSHPWNISRARNNAIDYARREGYKIVAFFDNDIVPIEGYEKAIRMFESKLLNDRTILVPIVNESNGLGFRFGSGVIIASTRLLHELGGYDELYEGGGAEDIDLLHRAREIGVSVLIAPVSGLTLIHESHEPLPGRKEAELKNTVRYLARTRGEDVGFKSLLREEDHG